MNRYVRAQTVSDTPPESERSTPVLWLVLYSSIIAKVLDCCQGLQISRLMCTYEIVLCIGHRYMKVPSQQELRERIPCDLHMVCNAMSESGLQLRLAPI